MGLIKKLNTALSIWREAGAAGIRRKIGWKLARGAQRRAYVRWLSAHGTPSPQERDAMRRHIAGFAERPLISVILPVYNVDEKWLRSCIDSVFDQIYPHWELCIADDRSPSPHVRQVLEEYAVRDTRVKVHFRASNGHISAASNSALELAAGVFSVLLDHDDVLSADALFWVANELNEHPDAAMIYSDEDMIDTLGRRYSPNFKPDFSYDLLLSLNLVTHLSAYKTELLRSIGGFRLGLEGSQDYDLALRVIEQIPGNQIRHIPKILYHWRAIPGSVALNSDEKPYAHEMARVALRGHLERIGVRGEVTATHRNLHRVRYELPNSPPQVSVIADAGDGWFDAVRLTSDTDYPSFEIVMVGDSEPAVGIDTDVKVVVCSSPSRAARLNFAAGRAVGEIFVFVRGRATPRDGGWLEELVRFLARDEVGAVGGRIVAPDDTVEGGGLIVGAGRGVAAAFGGLPIEFPGMTARNDVIGNFSAVSDRCLAVRREDFERLGRFDEQNLPNALFAADLCLKLAERGMRVVWTPYAELRVIDKRGAPAPTEDELSYFKKRWPRQTSADPFYNPNLSKRDGTFRIDA